MSLPAPPHVHVVFDGLLEAPRQVRQAVSAVFTDPDSPLARAALLVVSELVTNVIMHTHGGGVTQAWNPGPDGRLRIEVEDHSTTPPTPRAATGGRGLQIVDELADLWGVTPTENGKIVWAEFSQA